MPKTIVDQSDLIPIIKSILNRDMIGITINSFDNFIQHGLDQIARSVFEMKFEMDSKDTTERDATIEKYALDITIDAIRTHKPIKHDYTSQRTFLCFLMKRYLRILPIARMYTSMLP